MKLFLNALRNADSWVAGLTLKLPKRLKGLELRDDLNLLQAFGRRFLVYGIIGLLGFLLLYAGYWLLYTGPRTWLSNPSLQTTIPTSVPTPTTRPIVDLWKDHDWLTSQEALLLREQANVVNLAYLDTNGGVKYSAGYSYVLSSESPWEKAGKPSGISELSVTVTVVNLTARDQQFVLNALQPFVLSYSPNEVFVVDIQGQLWRASLTNLQLRSLAEVVDSLPLGIEPNPSLSLSY